MRRIILFVVIFQLCEISSASLNPGWDKNNWLTDFSLAQEKARTSGKPIFLYFDAVWCSWCQEYKKKTLDKPEVQRTLVNDFIPVVIDYDVQPYLFSKLGGRGLPYNVILSPDGKILDRFVGLLTPGDLLAQLKKITSNARQSPGVDQFDMFEPVTVEDLDHNAYQSFRAAFLQHIELLYSEEQKTLAGYYQSGVTLKRPSPLTWMWLLEQPSWRQRALIAAKVESDRLWDSIDGGFFQYLQTIPPQSDYLETSKLLEVNARLAQWMARTGVEEDKLQGIARKATKYLLATLRDKASGAFYQSQIADQSYYQLPPMKRKIENPPPVDKVIRMDTNAETVIALLDLSKTLQDTSLQLVAAKSFEFLLKKMIANNQRFHIYSEGKLYKATELADECWLLAAGLELQKELPNRNRPQVLVSLAQKLRINIDKLIKTPPAKPVDAVTLGLIAWIATQSSELDNEKALLPLSQARWALRQIRLDTDTPPDDLVYALRAWEQLLNVSDNNIRH